MVHKYGSSIAMALTFFSRYLDDLRNDLLLWHHFIVGSVSMCQQPTFDYTHWLQHDRASLCWLHPGNNITLWFRPYCACALASNFFDCDYLLLSVPWSHSSADKSILWLVLARGNKLFCVYLLSHKCLPCYISYCLLPLAIHLDILSISPLLLVLRRSSYGAKRSAKPLLKPICFVVVLVNHKHPLMFSLHISD